MPGTVLDTAIIMVKGKVFCLFSLRACRLWRVNRNKIVKPVIVEGEVQGVMICFP